MRTSIVLLSVLLASTAACSKKKKDGDGRADRKAKPMPSDPLPSTPPADQPALAGATQEPPPADAYRGKNRLINLWIDQDGKTQKVDLWLRRGMKYGPVRLAEGIEFGKVSPWFGVPEHMAVVVLPAGAGPDDKELSHAAYGKPDEIVTGLLTYEKGASKVVALFDVSKTMPQAPKPAVAGKGLIKLYAGPLMAFEAALGATFGGRSFHLGDGTGTCVHQRVEDEKLPPMILGGTQAPELDVAPGTTKLSLHKWPAPSPKANCAMPSVFDFTVDVAADKAAWVFVYTPDAGKTLATLTLPLGE